MAAAEAENLNELRARKDTIRTKAKAARRSEENKEESSRQICETVIGSAQYRVAGKVLIYLSQAVEVQTGHLMQAMWNQEKRVMVPCCHGEELKLFQIETVEELAPRTMGILEPRAEVRQRVERHVAVEELDMVVVPGVAFGRDAGRVGYGRGFYDRLLQQVRPNTSLVGLAFECQMFDKVPTAPHDVFMDMVITERAIYHRPTV